jgi:hypothetical protein
MMTHHKLRLAQSKPVHPSTSLYGKAQENRGD